MGSTPGFWIIEFGLRIEKRAGLQSLDEVLAKVSRNVQESAASIPDFVCNETVTSTASDAKGKINKRVTVESIFAAHHRTGPSGPTFVESREVVTVNGKTSGIGTKAPKLPFQYGGGFSSILMMTFLPDNLGVHTYTLVGSERVDGGEALRVDFATKEDQRKLRLLSQRKTFVTRDKGTAWIDVNAMRVIRLERNHLDIPELNSLSVAVDYGEFSIGGAEFWLPKTVRAEATYTKNNNRGIYNADYIHCRKFGTSVEIKSATP